tara:strand:- start:37 stop:555 length:519 start_codon:yes stop_codon:yes gene_type:complete
MTSKLKVNLINDSGDNNLITSDGSGSVTLGTAFPAKFGQIIYGTYNTATNTSSTSYVDTGLNANITPSSTSSKVLVMAKIHGMWNNAGAGRAMLFKILRDSTEIQNPVLTANFIGNVSGSLIGATCAMDFLDSPSSTSALNYKIQYRANNAAQNTINANSDISSITLIEVLA